MNRCTRESGSALLTDLLDTLKSDASDFSLDRLKIGVDNLRCDVLLSNALRRAMRTAVLQSITRHVHEGAGERGPLQNGADVETFKRRCVDLFRCGIHLARAQQEPQIDSLAAITLIRMLKEEIYRQIDLSVGQMKQLVRQYEVSGKSEEALKLKEMLGWIRENQVTLVFRVSREMAGHVQDLWEAEVKELRRVNLGEVPGIPVSVFANPMIYFPDPRDDGFTLRAYGLFFGRRPDDPDNYAMILLRLRDMIRSICFRDTGGLEGAEEGRRYATRERRIDAWMMRPVNVDTLFNLFQTRFWYRKAKKESAGAAVLMRLKKREKDQKTRFRMLYREAKRSGLLAHIVAKYEIQPLYKEYCPPLVPHLVAQYLFSRRARKLVAQKVKRIRTGTGGRPLSLAPLQKKQRAFRRIGRQEKSGYLLRFFKEFVRYHRDMVHYHGLKEAMEQVNIVSDDRMVHLARANDTLYEFRPDAEKGDDAVLISGHVVLKADVRKSTDITHEMTARGLNPATHFSLNFFNPINQVLPEYGAEKVFVEGDAIILSLFDYGSSQQGHYSVARACGLAAAIIGIVQKCNEKNRKARLPLIEIGIGITFRSGKPAFLFDGDHQIMISSAINLADRLSACSRRLRHQMNGHKGHFNLYVFQQEIIGPLQNTKDDLLLRYNVNGVELSGSAFRKLRREIDLKVVKTDARGLKNQNVTLYAGRFPLVDGRYRDLVIREGLVPRIDIDSMKVLGVTGQTYFEVCTHPGMFRFVQKRMREQGAAPDPGVNV